ncbi:MAG: winged helix-turn-helix transcriptional regulator [Nitrososphaeria archaeon]|nr:winged helix-turn-helix transcriptional regulator [Nitrososphaeria archaeon]
MDKKDFKILEALQEDVRSSYREIARKTELSVGTVLSRIKSMEKKRVIKGYGVILDPEKMGYEIAAIIEIRVSGGKLVEVEREVAKSPNVYGVYDVTGESDAIVIARFKKREELSRFIKSLLSMEFVERTITHVVLNTVKEDFSVKL